MVHPPLAGDKAALVTTVFICDPKSVPEYSVGLIALLRLFTLRLVPIGCVMVCDAVGVETMFRGHEHLGRPGNQKRDKSPHFDIHISRNLPFRIRFKRIVFSS
jgi:hypothetical protein